MNIHEYQAKKIFSKYSIPINPSRLVKTPEEALRESAEIYRPGKLLAVKAQVHAGGRGKGGGVKVVRTAEEAAEAARVILGMQLVTPQTGPEGKPVDSVLIEAASSLAEELYVGIILDREACKPCLILSTEGGMDIEEVAAKTPERIKKIHFSVEDGLGEEAALEAAEFMVKEQHRLTFSNIVMSLSRIFIDYDATLIEVNPLAIMNDGKMAAIDAKINLDDHALYRHPQLQNLYDARQEDPREVEAKKYNLSYVGLEGEIGCVVNGAGLAMATMDIIKYAGAEPANFLDVGGGADQDKVAAAFRILLADKRVRAILINIFGGIMRCDVLAEGILKAVESMDKSTRARLDRTPIVVRLEGTNAKEGKALLDGSSLNLVSAATFEEAAEKVVAGLKS